LIRVAGVVPPFRATDVGFRLGPRLNAAGRLRRPDEALELLLTRDPARAAELAAELDERNRERQAEEQKVVEEARQRVIDRVTLPAIVVEWSEGWHRGVVGIAASRIAREFHRPAVLISLDGATGVGSGRSIQGIHLHQFLLGFESELVRFGGHAQAIGLEIERSKLAEVRARLESAAAASWPVELLQRRHEYELEVAPRAVDENLLERLLALQPHGMGNPHPVLRVGPLTLDGPPRVFGQGHLRALARGDDGGAVRLLLWHRDPSEAAATLPERLEVLAQLDWDSYAQAPVLEVVASRPAGPA
jgi:single-stranded-DNA-specific exonuclease